MVKTIGYALFCSAVLSSISCATWLWLNDGLIAKEWIPLLFLVLWLSPATAALGLCLLHRNAPQIRLMAWLVFALVVSANLAMAMYEGAVVKSTAAQCGFEELCT